METLKKTCVHQYIKYVNTILLKIKFKINWDQFINNYFATILVRQKEFTDLFIYNYFIMVVMYQTFVEAKIYLSNPYKLKIF